MTVTSDAVTAGQKEIKTDWPIEEGLILGTTKRSTEPASLVPELDLTFKDSFDRGL